MRRVYICLLVSLCACRGFSGASLKNLVKSITTSSDISQVLPYFNQVSLSDFDGMEKNIERLRRITMGVATSQLIDTPYIRLSLLAIPKSAKFPLHSQGGTVYYKALTDPMKVRDFYITSIEDTFKEMRTTEDLGFIDADRDDDCVCRGGRCPRQYGCSFWVEKQLQDSKKYLLTELREETLDVNVVASRKQCNGPRELQLWPDAAASASASLVLELLHVEEGVGDSIPNTLFYRRVEVKRLFEGDEQKAKKIYKVTSAGDAFGLSPMSITLPWE